MADGDHYSSYAEVKAKFMNSGLGEATNTIYNTAALDLSLDITQVWINLYVFGDADHADMTGGNAVIAKLAQLDLVFMMILQARHMQENNLADAAAIQSYWQTSPTMTYNHKQLLDMISLTADGAAFAGDVRTGQVY